MHSIPARPKIKFYYSIQNAFSHQLKKIPNLNDESRDKRAILTCRDYHTASSVIQIFSMLYFSIIVGNIVITYKPCREKNRHTYRESQKNVVPSHCMSKNLYIIAGCNGAGKTTASYTVLPDILECREFVNADEIAKGLSPFNPESVAFEAGRLMLQRIDDLLEANETFSIETTLATKSYVNLVRRAQHQGYFVHLIFFWLESPELAINRVAERVSKGGHNIPVDVIRRRYVAGLKNLFERFANEVDLWMIYDNSRTPRTFVAQGGKAMNTTIASEVIYNKMKHYV